MGKIALPPWRIQDGLQTHSHRRPNSSPSHNPLRPSGHLSPCRRRELASARAALPMRRPRCSGRSCRCSHRLSRALKERNNGRRMDPVLYIRLEHGLVRFYFPKAKSIVLFCCVRCTRYVRRLEASTAGGACMDRARLAAFQRRFSSSSSLD